MSDTETPTNAPDNLAKAGPHPHESKDFANWKGEEGTNRPTTGLPEGVEPYRGDTETGEGEPERV